VREEPGREQRRVREQGGQQPRVSGSGRKEIKDAMREERERERRRERESARERKRMIFFLSLELELPPVSLEFEFPHAFFRVWLSSGIARVRVALRELESPPTLFGVRVPEFPPAFFVVVVVRL